MKNAHPFHALLLPLLGLASALPSQENLELGKMWTFENPPLDHLKKEYGFAPNQKWIDTLRLASLRFGNWCSSSFVSPKGLIMTNHHCARDNIAAVSPPGKDWVENGFYASSLEDEVRLMSRRGAEVEPVSVQQLVSMKDVTAAMNEGLGSNDDDATVNAKREKNEEAILEAAKAEHANLTAQVVKIHQGAIFQLYLYKVWDDIRLVCAPHLQTAHFGGDPDNFTYPRYSIDFAFVRAYEDGKPADTSSHYFRWKNGGAKENDLVFVTGNPGSTGRLLTHAQLEYMRDAQHPIQLSMIDNQLKIVRQFSERDPNLAKALRQNMLSLENSQKALGGYQSGVLDESLMAAKRQSEAAFKAKVAADPRLQRAYGQVWDQLAEIAVEKTKLEAKLGFYSPSYGFPLVRAFAIAIAVNPDMSEEDRQEARQQALKPARRMHALYMALFIDHLTRAREFLGDDDPYVKATLGGTDPISAARNILQSKVSQDKFVKDLLDGGAAAVAASEDAAIVIARVIAPLAEQYGKLSEALDVRESVQGALLGQALHAVYGDKVSPDATMTLRFSDGLVKGYPYNGT
ncbi:MAG: S46 family peptidase, partial [Planctomycetota bacterium]|nr:S46 family peptidase [Planctomycetota bacterium]